MDQTFGPISMHMLQHIVLMNVAAPVLVYMLRDRLPPTLWHTWPWATAVQLVTLWGWHAPGAFDGAMESLLLMVAMQVSLFAAAFWFWSALQTMPVRQTWRAMLALLVTGKLFCLLGALLAFSPGLLYGGHHAAMGHMTITSLADQQLAGLVMLIACPITYVAYGVILSVRWFTSLQAPALSLGRRAR